MEMKMEANDLTTHLSEELISRLESGGDLEGMMSSEIFQQGNLYMDDQEEEDNEPDDVIILHMDIREPLRTLQKLIEQKIGVDLKGYVFWLQDAQVLEPHKNLVDQCVKGEGLVQINVQIQTINQRINIVDVLKPTEAALAALSAEDPVKKPISTDDLKNEEESQDSTATDTDNKKNVAKKAAAVTTDNDKDKPCLNWVLDSKFKKEQTRLKIPDDPNDWTIPQVKHWFQWAVRQFDLVDVVLSDWAITGKELCSLTHEEFRKKLPADPGNVFWTHLQLLKECKFVSVVHKAAEGVMPEPPKKVNNTKGVHGSIAVTPKEQRIMRKTTLTNTKGITLMSVDGSPTHSVGSNGSAGSPYGVGSGNNGQVQLWQFLLEILTDREHTDIIQWVGTDGEFKLTDPERVARLWGEKKNKPAMNYEKLSRALRYYYDGDMISKVSGKRFAYKFDCDLKLLIGYDASELSKLVNEKPFMDESMYLDQINVQSDDE